MEKPWISLQVDFSVCFPADAVKCQFSNIGLQFVLVEQIHNAQLLNIKKNH